MTKSLGTDPSKFGSKDLVADVDAWLVAKALNATSASTLSGVLRDLLKMTAAQRIKKFYADRFGSSAENIATALAQLADGIDVGAVKNFPLSDAAFRRLADVDPPPTPDEAKICGRAFGQLLARLGS